jgi:hypothetical protein
MTETSTVIDRVGRVAVPVGDQDRATNVILTTRDIDDAHAALRGKGAEVSRMGDPVPPMVWFRDQDGNILLLVEERPDR